jgi:aryl-alcohol dehydrogenase-like predicted oxidoreductase
MKTRPLGRTGVEVSALCLGTMYFGSRNDRRSSFQLLDQYIEAGGTFLDTANIYAHWVPGCIGGESETLLGHWLKERHNRQQIFVATKVGFDLPGVERGLRAGQITAECDKSLKRLGLETIDLYYAHVDDRHTPLEETMAAFDRLVQAGKVRFIGASNFLAWRLEQANWVSKTNSWARYCCIQQRYSYLRLKPGASTDPQVVANDDLLDLCRSEDVTILAYSALLSGAYTRDDRALPEEYVGPDSDIRLLTLQAVAEECRATPNQVILAWMMQSEPSVLPLIAASNSAQLQENLAALELQLSAEQLERLSNAAA